MRTVRLDYPSTKVKITTALEESDTIGVVLRWNPAYGRDILRDYHFWIQFAVLDEDAYKLRLFEETYEFDHPVWRALYPLMCLLGESYESAGFPRFVLTRSQLKEILEQACVLPSMVKLDYTNA